MGQTMNNFKTLGWMLLSLAALPAVASAELAYAARQLHLRAGPAIDYPVVLTLPAGVVLDVQGCLSDYRWCDVVAGPDRGWVYAANIVYSYQGAPVPVLNYGAVIGIGIIAFSLGTYWDTHYVGRPWYPQRQLWIRRAPPPRFVPPGHRPPPAVLPGHRPPNAQRPAPAERRQGRPASVQHPDERHPPQGERHPPQKEQGPGAR